jgi:hypothetical protein
VTLPPAATMTVTVGAERLKQDCRPFTRAYRRLADDNGLWVRVSSGIQSRPRKQI